MSSGEKEAPPKKRRRQLVLAIPAGVLASVLGWVTHDRYSQATMPKSDAARLEKLEGEVAELRAIVDKLKLAEDERAQKAKIDAAIEERLKDLASKLGPGKVQ